MPGPARADLDPVESCRLFCAWKGGGPCLANDCPRMTEEQHAAALTEIEALMVNDPRPDTDEGKILNELATRVEKHERVKFPFNPVCVRPKCNGATARKLDGSYVCVMCGVVARSKT